MKLRTTIQVLVILLATVFASSNSCVAQMSGLRLVGADWQYKDKTLNDVPIEDLCKDIQACYGVGVFLEKGIQANVSVDGKGSKLPEALIRILKPHGLHVHLESVGVFVSREPIPDNVVLLPGNVQLELAIPKGREQQQYDSFSSKWEQGDSRIVVRAEKIDKSLKQIGEERIEGFAKNYKVTQQQSSSIAKDGNPYLAIRVGYKPTKERLRRIKEELRNFKESSRKYEEGMSRNFPNIEPEKLKTIVEESRKASKKRLRLAASEMVSDEILFKNGDYLYTVEHAYPKSAAKAGAQVSKRLWETINWEQTSKFKRMR